MRARMILLLATTTAALAAPSSAGAEPIWDCQDAPFRLVGIACFAQHTAEGVIEQIPPAPAREQ